MLFLFLFPLTYFCIPTLDSNNFKKFLLIWRAKVCSLFIFAYSWFLMRNPQSLELFSYRQYIIFLAALKRFFFILVFSSLIMMCLAWIFLCSSYLEFTELLESVCLCLLPNMGSFQPLFFPVFFFFPALYFFLFLWDLIDTNVKTFWYNLTGSWGSVH